MCDEEPFQILRSLWYRAFKEAMTTVAAWRRPLTLELRVKEDGWDFV